MQPVWARKFEPPAISSTESVGVIQTLLALHRATGEERFLTPIPTALEWLKMSAMSDGRYARFYELQTNKPLFLTKDYQLTYEPNDLPTHYSFVRDDIGLARLERQYRAALAPRPAPQQAESPVSEAEVRRILAALDERGGWVEQGTLKSYNVRGAIIDSATFIRNVDRLSRYIVTAQGGTAKR